jgi:hypothetical protein
VNIKKKNMLVNWILDHGTCGKHFKESLVTFGLTKSMGVNSAWLSQEEALTKYGKSQLQQMVAAGTILHRRMASDPRFFEFQAMTEVGSTHVVANKSTSIKSSGSKALSNNDAITFGKLDLKSLTEKDFELDALGDEASGDEAAEKDPNKDLLKALEIKVKGKNVSNNEKKQKKTDPLEVMSRIGDKDGKADIKKKMMTFKKHLSLTESDMMGYLDDLKAGKHVKELACVKRCLADTETSLESLNKLIKNASAKKEDQKNALMAAYNTMQNAKSIKASVKKLLPKKLGKKKTKEATDDDDEQDEE